MNNFFDRLFHIFYEGFNDHEKQAPLLWQPVVLVVSVQVTLFVQSALFVPVQVFSFGHFDKFVLGISKALSPPLTLRNPPFILPSTDTSIS